MVLFPLLVLAAGVLAAATGPVSNPASAEIR